MEAAPPYKTVITRRQTKINLFVSTTKSTFLNSLANGTSLASNDSQGSKLARKFGSSACGTSNVARWNFYKRHPPSPKRAKLEVFYAANKSRWREMSAAGVPPPPSPTDPSEWKLPVPQSLGVCDMASL
ncbi:unnamed protein product, partial [Iphiclides podalirius]